MSHVLVDRGVALVEYVTLWPLEELCEAWREGRGKLGVSPESFTLGGHPNGCLSTGQTQGGPASSLTCDSVMGCLPSPFCANTVLLLKTQTCAYGAPRTVPG